MPVPDGPFSYYSRYRQGGAARARVPHPARGRRRTGDAGRRRARRGARLLRTRRRGAVERSFAPRLERRRQGVGTPRHQGARPFDRYGPARPRHQHRGHGGLDGRRHRVLLREARRGPPGQQRLAAPARHGPGRGPARLRRARPDLVRRRRAHPLGAFRRDRDPRPRRLRSPRRRALGPAGAAAARRAAGGGPALRTRPPRRRLRHPDQRRRRGRLQDRVGARGGAGARELAGPGAPRARPAHRRGRGLRRPSRAPRTAQRPARDRDPHPAGRHRGRHQLPRGGLRARARRRGRAGHGGDALHLFVHDDPDRDLRLRQWRPARAPCASARRCRRATTLPIT